MLRLCGEAVRPVDDDMAGTDVIGFPDRSHGRWLEKVVDQPVDLAVVELTGETGHLRRWTTVANDRPRPFRLQSVEAFRQQCRTTAAEPRASVTGLAMLAIKLLGIIACGQGGSADQQGDEQGCQAHSSALPTA
ncbi:hypothetical protein D3C78_1032380 [compost metagenome]